MTTATTELRADDATTSETTPRWIVTAAAFAAAVAVPFIRQSGNRTWNTLWTEDGAIYTHDANTMPIHETLLRGYAGYAQLSSRLTAIPTRYLPLEWISHYIALASATTAALLAVFVWRASGSHIENAWARFALASACVVTPVLVPENELTLTNTPWLLTFAAFWAIVSRQDTRWDIAARAAVVFFAITATPVATLYIPLLAGVVWARRRRADVIVAAAYLTGLLVQAAAVLVTDSQPRVPTSPADVGVLYQVRVVEAALLGDKAVRGMWPRWGVAPATVLTILMAAAFAIALKRRSSRVAVAAIAGSVILYALPVYFRGSSGMRLFDGIYNNFGARYTVIPLLLLVSAAAILSKRRWVAIALAAQIAVLALVSLTDVENRRPGGPSWVEGVRQAREWCASEPDDAVAQIPIDPTVTPTMGWHAELPCDRLR